MLERTPFAKTAREGQNTRRYSIPGHRSQRIGPREGAKKKGRKNLIQFTKNKQRQREPPRRMITTSRKRATATARERQRRHRTPN